MSELSYKISALFRKCGLGDICGTIEPVSGGLYVLQADSILRYREGDYNEKEFTKGDGNALPATPEEIIALKDL